MPLSSARSCGCEALAWVAPGSGLGPVLGLLVFGWCGLERALDDLLGQGSDLEVAVLGVAGKEGERLVLVDAVALHEDSHGGADLGAGLERLAQLLDLFGV